MKLAIIGTSSVTAGIISALFGGWTTGLTVYAVFSILDLILGTLNAFLGVSDKSSTGAYNSMIGWRGLIKKIVTLALIVMCHYLDVMLGTIVIMEIAVFFFIFNEGTSILENCSHWIEVPTVIQDALDVIKEKLGYIDFK